MECRKFKFAFAAMLFVCLCATASAQVSEFTGNNFGIVPGMVNDRGEEIVGTKSGFAAVVTLDDRNLKTLIERGRVEVAIPRQLVNSVDSVIVKRPVYFKETKAKDFANAQLSGRKLVVDVDRSVLERIDYQPVELKVYESGFTSVVLNYDARSRSTSKAGPVGDPATDSPMILVKLKSGNGIAGRIRNMKKLDIDSSIGNISVEFARTNKIMVRDGGELGIEMINGDLISGTVDDGEIVLINRWSDETIKLSEVSALIVQQESRLANRTGKNMTKFNIPNRVNQKQTPMVWAPQVVPYQ